MTVTVGKPDPHAQRDIQGELAELRRQIAELEQQKKQLEQQVKTSTTVREVAPAVTTAEELNQTLQAFIKRVAMILQAEKCVLMTYEPETGDLVAKSPALRLTDEEITALRVHADQGITGEVFREAKPIICNDNAADARCMPELVKLLKIRDSLTVPMLIERRNEDQQVVERKIIGVIHVFNKRYGLKFTDEDIKLLTVLGRNAASVISSAQAFLQIASEKKQLEYTLQSMVSGLLLISPNERIQLLNTAAAHVLGLEAKTAPGKLYKEIVANEEMREFFNAALKDDSELGKEFIIGDHFYQVQTSRVRDEKRHNLGLLCIFNDVTELRNVERMKSDFVSTVSHELRTPLTAIKGFISTLLSDPDGEFYDHDTRMEFYGIIDSECDRLVRLISDLLNVSRIERGLPLHLNYDTVDVGPVLEKCVGTQRGYTTKHTLETAIPDGLPSVVADRDKLEQIIHNLVSNAIKYSPDGGNIVIGVSDEQDKLRFSIRDQGMGIPAEHIDKIFQRFHRVHQGDSQRVGGTGIGLFLVKSLVEAHGGVIWVESALGEGSTFFFTIPKQPANAQ